VRDYACGSIHPGGVPLPFLLLAVLCSASVALLLRWSGGRGLDGHVVTTANYAAGYGARAGSVARGRVPLMGRVRMCDPLQRKNNSGEEETT